MSELIAVVSDLHVNSTLGLIAPSADLDDGGNYRQSKAQEWMYENWLNFWDRIHRIKTNTDSTLTVILNGDTVDGMQNHSTQFITDNPATMVKMAIDVLYPALIQCDRVIVIRGTANHVGASGNLEESLAFNLHAAGHNVMKCTETDTYTHWRLLMDISDVRFDITHHSSMGRLPWTRSNALNSLAVRLMLEYATGGQRIPDIAIRSHNHQYGESGSNYPVRVIACPAWQLNTEYSYRGSYDLATIGGLWVLCDGGRYTWDAVRYAPEPRKVYVTN